MDEAIGVLNAILEGQKVTHAKLEGMELRLSRVEGHLVKVDERLDRIEARLDHVEERLNLLTDYAVETRSRVTDVQSSLGFLVHKVGQHEHDIHVLKAKLAE